jgi:hypothetical protein
MADIKINDSVEKLKQNADFKGLWVPKEILFDNTLNWVEKVCLITISNLDNSNNHCTAGNNYIANFIGCSETRVSNAVAKLIELNYVSEISFDGRVRTLISNIKYDL